MRPLLSGLPMRLRLEVRSFTVEGWWDTGTLTHRKEDGSTEKPQQLTKDKDKEDGSTPSPALYIAS